MRPFNELVRSAVPAIGSEYLQQDDDTHDVSWAHEKACESLLNRLPREEESKRGRPATAQLLQSHSSNTWRYVWTLYVAAILLFAAVIMPLYSIPTAATS
jgi:hypothetical protein